MAKTIIASVTLHVKDEKRSKKAEYDRMTGFQISGKHVVIEVPPKTPVQFEDDAEADKIISRHAGELTDLPPAIVIKKRAEEADTDEIITLAASKAPKSGKSADAAA